MAKGKHREATRVVLPGGLWVLLYADGGVKVAGYDRRFRLVELSSRGSGAAGDGGAAVHGASLQLDVETTAEQPREIAPRRDDLVCIPRATYDALSAVLPAARP